MTNHLMGLIEDFIESEKVKLNWLQKLSANYPDVIETSVLAGISVALPEKPEKIIKPSIFRRSMYFVALLVALFSWWFCLYSFVDHQIPLPVRLFFLPFLSLFVVGLFRCVFGKRYNYTLRINASKLSIRDSSIVWDEVVDTAIMRQSRARGVDRYLVIFKRDGSIEKLDLFLFGISDRRLAAVVESYKALAIRPTANGRP
jgi:hypothetical protein